MGLGHHLCCNKQKVKRGLWSPEEDEKLINYISTYGHGCWSSIPSLAGLQRCGKSCRLRWINYLRPDLKRGSFSPQEAALIIQLHAILGNRWAQIAKHLPGRTDNEVKNFWNSSVKKKILSHGLYNQLPPNPSPTIYEGFIYPLTENPNLIPSYDQRYQTPSILQGLDPMANNYNFNLAPPPPLDQSSSSYDNPTLSLNYYDQNHVLEKDHYDAIIPPHDDDDDDDKLMAMPMMTHDSCVIQQVESINVGHSTLASRDMHVPDDEMDYDIEAIMSLVPQSPSSSLSSLTSSSSLSPLSCSQFVVNPILPSNLDH